MVSVLFQGLLYFCLGFLWVSETFVVVHDCQGLDDIKWDITYNAMVLLTCNIY